MTETSPGPAHPLPWWIRALDAGVCIALVLAVCAVAFGGLRVNVGEMRLSITSGIRPAIAAAALAAIRHRLRRSPSLLLRLRDGAARAARSPGVRAAAAVTGVSRVAVLCIGLFAIGGFGFPPDHPPYRISRNEAVNLPLRWDAGWYLGIALHGYSWNRRETGEQNVVFFPALPLLMRLGAEMLGARAGDSAPSADGTMGVGALRLVWVGMGIVTLAFAAALAQLYALARDSLGFDHERAVGALILLAAYPFAVFYSAPYTEALFLLAAIGAFRTALTGRWGQAASWGLLAGLARPNGFLLAAPLAWIALTRLLEVRRTSGGGAGLGGRRRELILAAGALLAPLTGPIVYSAWMYRVTGRPLVWLEGHSAWGRRYESVAVSFTNWTTYFFEQGPVQYVLASPPDALNVLAVIFGCAAVWGTYRRLGPAYGIFVLSMLAPPLLMGGIMSVGRFTSVMFPVFLWLAASVSSTQRLACVALFAACQALAAALFFTWRPIV
jgi:hypothetical protein